MNRRNFLGSLASASVAAVLALTPSASPAQLLLTGAGPGGFGAAVAGSALSVLGQTVHVQYHAGFGVTTNAGRVTACANQGVTANADGSQGLDASSLGGPKAEVDGDGLPYWNFEGNSYLNIANGFVASQQAVSFIVVMRHAKAGSGHAVVSLGNATAGTAVTTGAAAVGMNANSVGPYLKGSTISATTAASGREYMLVGSQKQVVGVFSRSTGQRLFINNKFVDVAATSTSATNVVGGEVGRYAFSPGAVTDVNYNSGAWLQGHIYELIIIIGTVSNAQAVAAMAAVTANHAIAEVEHSVIYDGDSIDMGTTAPPNYSPTMLLTNPGHAMAVNDNVRVLNVANSGDKIAELTTRRDATNSVYSLGKISGGKNIVVLEIGRNNWPTLTGAQTYALLTPLIHTTTTGYIERGWEVLYQVNQASSALQTKCNDYRTLIRDIATFRSDCAATSSQLNLVEVPLITISGQTIFDTATDSESLVYYSGNPGGNTHLQPAGYTAKIYGGDTPQYSVAYGLNARLAA